MGIFGTQKMLMCTLLVERKMYGLYTHENVDIYVWPLSLPGISTLRVLLQKQIKGYLFKNIINIDSQEKH